MASRSKQAKRRKSGGARELRAGHAAQVLSLLEVGGYDAPSGEWVELREPISHAVHGTELWRPDKLARVLDSTPERAQAHTLELSVSGESTQAAAQRLVLDEGVEQLALLNFASARNPGGGFLGGAQAQEEDLARSSALYLCLSGDEAAPYYRSNRVKSTTLYTDHMIWSPRVPFFRVEGETLLEQAFCCSVITAPAPNAGPYLARGGRRPKLEQTLRRRAGMVLALAEAQQHRNLLLGAWGCGVFRNEPRLVADAFGQWLESERFAGAFERVVFAVLDPKGKTRAAFNSRFPRPGIA